MGGRLASAVLLVLLSLLLTLTRLSAAEQGGLNTALKRDAASRAGVCAGHDDGMVVLSLLDGSVRAINAQTGIQMWSVDFSRPAAMSWSKEGWPEIVPSVDGAIYVFDTEKDELQQVQGVHIQSPESSEQAVILSYRETKALYVDRCTGKVLRALSYHGGTTDLTENCPSSGGWASPAMESEFGSNSDIVILRSVESGVKVIDFANQEVANGSVLHFSPSLYQNGECTATKELPAREQYSLQLSPSRTEIRMLAEDGETVLWEQSLPSFAVEAYGLNGVSVDLEEEYKGINGPNSNNAPVVYTEDGGRSMVLVGNDRTPLMSVQKPVYVDNRHSGFEKHKYLPGGNFRDGFKTKQNVVQPLTWIQILATALFLSLFLIAFAILLKASSTKRASPAYAFPHLNGEENIASSSSKDGNIPSSGSNNEAESDSDETNFSCSINPGRRQRKGRISRSEDDRNSSDRPHYGNIPDGWMAVGRICVSPNVLGVGSHGTVVYEGLLQPGDRPVAVKRLLRYLYEAAGKEIQLLISLDESTQNIVRYFAMEEDHEFIYLALELCSGTLAERVQQREPPALTQEDLGTSLPSYTVAALRELCQGLINLHRAGVVHRDIKPQNVLLTRGDWRRNEVQVKIGDVGLATKLEGDRSSYSLITGGAVGTVGWRAPEVLRGERQTKAVDIFSAGCVYYFVLTGGHHPFGNQAYERDIKILNWDIDISKLDQHLDAQDLIKRMIAAEPSDRLSAEQVLMHPFFWPDSKKLAFLSDVADKLPDPRLRLMDRLNAEDSADVFLDWQLKLDMAFLKHLGKNTKTQRGYENNIAGLLRVIRNKRSHYAELNGDVQKILGPLPVEGVLDARHNYLRYFTTRFPKLLMYVYDFARRTPEICGDSQFSCYSILDANMKAPLDEDLDDLPQLERKVSRLPSLRSTRDPSFKKSRVVHTLAEMLSHANEDPRNSLQPSVRQRLMELRIYDPGARRRWTSRLSRDHSADRQKYAPPAMRRNLRGYKEALGKN